MSRRDEIVAAMKKQLDELNSQLDAAEAKVEQAKGDAKARFQEEVTQLRKQAKEARARVDDLRAAGEDRWDQAVAEAERVRDAFKHSFNYLKSQL